MTTTRPFDQTRKLLNLAIPIGLIEAVGHLLVITDLIVVGRLGALEFAAVGLAITFFWVLVVIGISVVSVVGVLVAETRARIEQEGEIGLYGAHGFWVCIIMMIVIAPAIWFMSDFLAFTSLQPELLPIIEEYTRAVVWALPPALLFAWLRSILIGLEISGAIAIIALVAIPMNLLLSILLVFGFGPLQGFGVPGAGYATALVNLAMFLALGIYIYRKLPRIFAALAYGIVNIERRILQHILRVGGGQGVITILENGMFAVVAILVGSLSVEALAAHNMVYAVLELGILIVLGFGEGTMIRVANSIGHRDFHNSYRVCGLALAFSFAIAAFISGGLIFAPDLVTAIFLSGDSGVNAAEVTLVLGSFVVAASLSLFFDAAQTILYHAVRATRDEFVPVLIAFAGYWIIGLGCGYVFGFIMELGIAGIWIGLAIGFFANALMMGMRLRNRFRYLQSNAASLRF